MIDSTDAQRLAGMLTQFEDAGDTPDAEVRWDRLQAARNHAREVFREVTGWTLVRKRGRWLVRR